MRQMRLAVQEQMVGGDTLEGKFARASELGFDGLELRGRGGFAFEKRLPELQAARKTGVIMPTGCVEMDHFIGDFDAGRRRDAIGNLKSQITTIVQAGGYGVITPASWGMFSLRLPPFTPPRTADEDKQVLLEALHELGLHAQREGGRVFLEPLNRYEDHMVNTLDAACALCEEVGVESLGVMADTYHMNIEEDDITASIVKARKWLGHVHVSESNRREPGTGHFAWKEFFAALKAIGFDGYMSMECRLSGKTDDSLKAATAFVRSEWQKA